MPDSYALAAYYEALRKEVVEAHGQTHSMHGRALLMRQGMWAWMRGIGETAAGNALPTKACEDLQPPAGIEQNLVAILASMALATTREIAT
jgi:hypothetical protein